MGRLSRHHLVGTGHESARSPGYFTKVDWGGGGTSDPSTYFGATTSRLVG